ncbi:MAG: rod shape-determining protein RodA [Chloroflexi bacterium]|nr:MAG: rod shape-determining protein RodA [Chloroflexota bacterium]
MEKRETWRHFDYWLFGAVIVLCIFGVAMIRSAVAGNEVLAGLVQRQMIFIAVSLVVILVTAWVDYHYWFSLSNVMYIVAVASLLGIFVFGTAIYGSARWLDTGLILIQPSELAKIIMILVLAAYFARNQDSPRDLRWIIRGLIMTFGVVIWILLQPNLSTSLVIMVMWFAMLWVSGLPTRYLIIISLVGMVFLILFLALLAFGIEIPFIQEYQLKRVANFLFPDPNARHGETYNVDQALITIGSGGWAGQGYGQGTQVQLRYLKVRHTDFIFAAMAEEFGFIGTVIIVSLLVFVIFRCFRAARHASDMFGALIAYGFGFLIFFQTAVNIGVNLKVIPVTGLTLPFISYGGSSLLSLALGIGLVESVIMRHKPLEF